MTLGLLLFPIALATDQTYFLSTTESNFVAKWTGRYGEPVLDTCSLSSSMQKPIACIVYCMSGMNVIASRMSDSSYTLRITSANAGKPLKTDSNCTCDRGNTIARDAAILTYGVQSHYPFNSVSIGDYQSISIIDSPSVHIETKLTIGGSDCTIFAAKIDTAFSTTRVVSAGNNIVSAYALAVMLAFFAL